MKASIILSATLIGVVGLTIAFAMTITLSSHDQTTSIIEFSAKTASSSVNKLGLIFHLSLNSTSIRQGGEINITTLISNSHTEMNNITAANSWALSYLLSNQTCPQYPDPIGFALLQGYYTLSNASGARPLFLFPPGESAPCRTVPTSYDFEASSDLINGEVVYPLIASTAYGGYFTKTLVSTGSNQSLQPEFVKFAQGTYTVLAGDEWSDVALLYFNVS